MSNPFARLNTLETGAKPPPHAYFVKATSDALSLD